MVLIWSHLLRLSRIHAGLNPGSVPLPGRVDLEADLTATASGFKGAPMVSAAAASRFYNPDSESLISFTYPHGCTLIETLWLIKSSTQRKAELLSMLEA